MKKKNIKSASITALALALALNIGCKNNELVKEKEEETTRIEEVNEEKYNIAQILVVKVTDNITGEIKYILCDSFTREEEYFECFYIEDYVMKNVIVDGKKIESIISLNQPSGHGWVNTYHSVLDDGYYINELRTLYSNSINYFESNSVINTGDSLYTEEVEVLKTNYSLFDETRDEDLSINKYNYSKMDLNHQEKMIKSEEELMKVETFFLTDLLNIKYDREFTLKELSQIQEELNKSNELTKVLV